MERSHSLYGVPHSLYTGKVRAYLRKQGIPFVERMPTDPAFRETIVPIIGRGIIPVLVTPDGTIVQDSADIIDHFEAQGVRASARPPGARQRVLAHLIELYAVVGLTRHAMHYRWSFVEQQRRFLEDAFAAGSGEAGAARVMGRMASYLPPLGVTPATIPAIERSFLALLDTLDVHFARHPYLFGGRASIGDYGLLGPMFAHLGRDPVPAGIMKTRAPRVFRWVERMNAADPDMPEFPGRAAAYLPGDEVPDTLSPLLRQIADELLPELTDKLDALVDYARQSGAEPGQPVSAKPQIRMVASVETRFRDVAHESGVQPYMLYLWQRVCDAFEALEADAQTRVRGCFESAGLAPVLDAIRPLRVERRGHVEVWGTIAGKDATPSR